MKRTEIRLAGSGGQGLITAARIMAKAALLDGLNALQSQVYGAEARGGATKSEVVMANREVWYPEVLEPDIVAIMTKASFVKYGLKVKKNGLRIIDTFMVPEYDDHPDFKTVGIPFTHYAETQLKNRLSTNIVLIGYLIAKTKVVRPESFVKAIGDFFKDEKLSNNEKAFWLGHSLLGKEDRISG